MRQWLRSTPPQDEGARRYWKVRTAIEVAKGTVWIMAWVLGEFGPFM